jgi:hypothetical protein
VLRLTLLTSAVASGTFFATLAYAPAVIDIGNLVWFGRTDISREVSASPAAPEQLDCRSPFARIVAALQQAKCR